MFKKIILLLLIISSFNISGVYSNDDPGYTQFRTIDAGTFNEYRYKITDEFFNFRNKYEIDGKINTDSANKILNYAATGYKYLPDSLINKNLLNYLKTSIERGIKYPNNASNYSSIVEDIEKYLENTNISAIKGKVEAFPSSGNAPLNVTLRGSVVDPTGTPIPSYNYTWWINENGKRKVLGNGLSLNYLFKEEGNFSVFLDVKSSHKNALGNIDVLSFSSRADIVVKEKIASLIIKVNSLNLRNSNELKFTPEEAKYGLLFDATSSTPTSGATFTKTTWDFGNGVVREYNGSPKIERVIYANEGDYTVKLKLRTNEGKQIERDFVVSIHNPIASIKASSEEGFLQDKFTFSAQSSGSDKNLTYSWEIIDLQEDKIVFKKAGTVINYSFDKKGKYNLKMKVTEPSGEEDVDTKIIYINSRPPVANFTTNIPLQNKPNRVFFDATKSYDPDFSDDGKLKFSWIINGERVELEESNYNASTGYFTFDSIGDHSVVLEVVDPDDMSVQNNQKVNIKSILSVEFFPFPRVAQRLQSVRFVAKSPEAKFYEWDFGDGNTSGGRDANISHKYEKSGIYNVTLKVRDSNDNVNTFKKNVYIGESDSPYSFIGLKDASGSDVLFNESACEGKGAYIVNRVDTVTFSGKESIDITGLNTGLTYSWKLLNEGFKTGQEFTKKFDELGCFPIKLTVKSDSNGKTHSTETYVQVKNLIPTLSSLNVETNDDSTDPVVVKVSALGAKDKDGVIQSYLWYYYTDIDPEPQDFRSTRTPETTFVLPKITGNYYFVVVMKDNNEDRANSEEITGSKYFITLAGDNLNTPLVKLSANNTSVAVGNEIIFSSSAQNILGQDLTNKVEYDWDFDGDGFYDEKTNSNTTTHTYTESGEKHARVKVSYKGFSNVKSLRVNVSNILKPDFGYISIGNKFAFFDMSIGKVDSYEWDLGDGTIVKNKKTFTHVYKDNKALYDVKLRISEGTKIQTKEYKVTKNIRNILKTKKDDGLIVFSNFDIDEEDNIILEEKTEKLFVYIGENTDDVINYVIDNDLSYDSSINGSEDDDEDNKNLDSYTNGSPIEVELNDSKIQKIRLYTKNNLGEIIDSRDITITKNYINEDIIDLGSIKFSGVPENLKLTIERLKTKVDMLPKEHKMKAIMYVQSLQDNWSDDTERTKIIINFESFIVESGIPNYEEITDLLSTLIVINQDNIEGKQIPFEALKNLLPKTIDCSDIIVLEGEETCYDVLASKLEAINNNSNIDENKILGSEVLKVIAVDTIMTTEDKNNFKAILKTIVYQGVENIPDEEKEEVLKEETKSQKNNLVSLILAILKWAFIIFALFAGIILLFYIYFLLFNKDKNLGFQDFIIEKTGGGSKKQKIDNNDVELDILEDLNKDLKDEEIKEEVIDKKVEEKEDEKEEQKEEQKVEEKEEEKPKQEEQIIEEKSEVPDWLKGNFTEEKSNLDSNKPEEKEKTKKEEKIIEKPKQEETEKEDVSDSNLTDKQIDKITKIEDDNIPDWLKGSFEEEKVEDTKKESKQQKLEDKKDKKEEKTSDKKSDDNIPDWLKSSFEEDFEEEKKEVKESRKVDTKAEASNKKEDKKPEIKKESSKIETSKKVEVKKSEPIKKESPKKVETKKLDTSKKDETKKLVKEKETKKQNPKKEVTKKEETLKKTNDLWDDGMKIPDWLKTDENK